MGTPLLSTVRHDTVSCISSKHDEVGPVFLPRILMAVLLGFGLLFGPATAADALVPLRYEHRVAVRTDDVNGADLRSGACADRMATEWARHLAASGRFYHRDQWEVIRSCDAYMAGEVLARGRYTPREVVRAWLGSPSHRAVITNSAFRRIGVGAVQLSDGRWVVVVNLLRH